MAKLTNERIFCGKTNYAKKNMIKIKRNEIIMDKIKNGQDNYGKPNHG